MLHAQEAGQVGQIQVGGQQSQGVRRPVHVGAADDVVRKLKLRLMLQVTGTPVAGRGTQRLQPLKHNVESMFKSPTVTGALGRKGRVVEKGWGKKERDKQKTVKERRVNNQSAHTEDGEKVFSKVFSSSSVTLGLSRCHRNLHEGVKVNRGYYHAVDFKAFAQTAFKKPSNKV